ncbi:MAG: AraC family transcriptional regulator ligand-binding domain-containing protein [Halioglobus sp.]
MTDYLIRAQGFGAIDQLLEELGCDVDAAFRCANLELSLLDVENGNLPVDYRDFLSLLNHCAEITDRQDFGLLLSRYQDMRVIGLPGSVMYEAPTLRAALHDLQAFFHLHMNGMRVIFDEGKHTSLIALEIVMPFPPSYRQQMELSLGIGLRFIRRLIGESWNPQLAHFEHAEDAGSASTAALFKCPISYGQEINGYYFDSSILDIPRTQFNSQSHQILYDYLSMQTRLVHRDLIIDITEQIVRGIRRGECGIDAVSAAAGYTRRTLQRKLAENNILYRDLLEQTRMDLAQRYLRVDSIPITDISDILCYAQLSVFSRAFQRYFGVAPRRWRQQLARGD